MRLEQYIAISILVILSTILALIVIFASSILGPKKPTEKKLTPYESGMTPINTARKRFNIRFYLIAMVFLVFDIEVIFLYPWAQTFTSLDPRSDAATIWLLRIFFFMLTTVVAYIYGYRKGVFKFD